jgi:hypothetical protein
MSTRPGIGLASLLVVLASCNNGTTGAADAGGADAGLSPAAVQTIDDVTLGLAVATALSAPLAPDGALVHGDLAPTDATTHTRAQHGFSGGSVVTPAGCATYSWSGLTATVTLTGCTLEANGMPVSGSVTLGVTTRPTVFTVTFTGLTVGTSTFDGHVSLTINGTDTAAAPPTLDVDLTYTSGGTSTHLTATGLSVTTTSTSVAITGTASVTSGSTTTSLTAAALTWQTGQCLPSSGTLMVSGSSVPPATLTFLSTTPTDGKVTVQIPPFPVTTQRLFPPCP